MKTHKNFTASLPRIIRVAVFCLLVIWTLNLAIHWGVREKTFWENFWDMFGGGAVGTAWGIGLFTLFGGAGLVFAGTGVGLGILCFSAIGGALGFGLGGIVHVIRNPSKYVFDSITIIPVVLVGILVSWYISKRVESSLKRSKTKTPSRNRH